MAEFDYQWLNLPSKATEYTEDRVTDLLKLTQLPGSFFQNKRCLDYGCGNGRFTWAMQKLGASVESFDVSTMAVEECKRINPRAYVFDIANLQETDSFDFVLCWGGGYYTISRILDWVSKRWPGRLSLVGFYTLWSTINVHRNLTKRGENSGRR